MFHITAWFQSKSFIIAYTLLSGTFSCNCFESVILYKFIFDSISGIIWYCLQIIVEYHNFKSFPALPCLTLALLIIVKCPGRSIHHFLLSHAGPFVVIKFIFIFIRHKWGGKWNRQRCHAFMELLNIKIHMPIIEEYTLHSSTSERTHLILHFSSL